MEAEHWIFAKRWWTQPLYACHFCGCMRIIFKIQFLILAFLILIILKQLIKL